MLKKVFLVLLLSVSLYNISFSKEKLITSIASIKDNKIEFFLGYRDKIKSGEELYILRKEEKIGKIKVTDVGEYSSWGEIIEIKENIKIEPDDVISNFYENYENKEEIKTDKKEETKKEEKSDVQKRLLEERYITGKIIIIYEDKLVINLGKKDGIKENYEFLILRDNTLVGRCKITSNIGSYTSLGEIIKLEEGKEVLKGDKLLTTKMGIAPKWQTEGK